MIRAAAVILTFLTAVTASAQQPLFDPDDFLDMRTTGGRPVLISRLVTGAGSNMTDSFRPLGEHVGYLHLANSFYWRSLQLDYNRSELRAEGGEAAEWQLPGQGAKLLSHSDFGAPSVLQTRNATPKSKDTLHAAWYWPIPGEGGVPVLLRSRLTFAAQPVDTTLNFFNGVRHLSGRERIFALDTDTWFRIAGHDVFGSLALSGTKTTGTSVADRDERALTYTNRFPAFSYDRAKILIRPTITVGGISNRGGSAVNLVSPAIEIFRPFVQSGANLHVIWAPQWAATGGAWKVTNQVLVLVDRALFVKVF